MVVNDVRIYVINKELDNYIVCLHLYIDKQS
jgi:hypothetical protein